MQLLLHHLGLLPLPALQQQQQQAQHLAPQRVFLLLLLASHLWHWRSLQEMWVAAFLQAAVVRLRSM
jgi:hypothetical protein